MADLESHASAAQTAPAENIIVRFEGHTVNFAEIQKLRDLLQEATKKNQPKRLVVGGLLTPLGTAVVAYLKRRLREGIETDTDAPATSHVRTFAAFVERQAFMTPEQYFSEFADAESTLLEWALTDMSLLIGRAEKALKEARREGGKGVRERVCHTATNEDAANYLRRATDADDFAKRRADVQRGHWQDDTPPLVAALDRLKTALLGDGK